MLLLLRQANLNQNTNHQDTLDSVAKLQKTIDADNRLTLCMLQVPLAQRTTDVEAQCRKNVATQQASNANNPTSTVAPALTSVTNNNGTPAASTPASVSPAQNNSAPQTPAVTTPPPAPASPGIVEGILKTLRGLL